MRVLLIPARLPSMTATAMLHTRPLGLAARPASRLQSSRRASSLHIRAASNDDGGSSDKAGRVTGGDGGKGFKRPDDATPLRVSLTRKHCQVHENATAMHTGHACAQHAVMHPRLRSTHHAGIVSVLVQPLACMHAHTLTTSYPSHAAGEDRAAG